MVQRLPADDLTVPDRRRVHRIYIDDANRTVR